MRTLFGLVGAAVLVFAGSGCGDKSKPTTGNGAEPSPTLAVIAQEDAPDGLAMRVREGNEAGRAGDRAKTAKATALSEGELEALLKRLPAFGAQAGDDKAFAFREKSMPPPRPGATVSEAFPPKVSAGNPPASASANLEVLRFSPEGNVPLAPRLSVTFSRPMVEVTSHAEAAKTVPVKITPTPPGKWRWIGTRTILFDPDKRFPMATTYKVEVSAGTVSAAGEKLDQAKSWTFTTPAPSIVRHFPQHGPQELEPLIFIEFDQSIDADKVAASMTLKGGRSLLGGQVRTGVERAGVLDIAMDSDVRALVDLAMKDERGDRFVVVKPVRPLPPGETIQVVIPKGTPSAEGPGTTESDIGFSFRTYGPLKITRARCGWGGRCPPTSPWNIEFSNPLDPEAFDPAMIRIEPKLPGKNIRVQGRNLSIRGLMVGRTTYKVTFPASIKDQFGQTLGVDDPREFQVGPANPALQGPSGLVVLDPYGQKPVFNVFSTNQKKLDVTIYKVTPNDWDAFASYMYNWRRLKEPPKPPGKIVFEGQIDATDGDDRLLETPIDLSAAFDGGLGHAVVIVKPVDWPQTRWQPRVQAWVQGTRIGLDAFVDGTELVAWANDLATGAPLGDVQLKLTQGGPRATTKDDGTATLALPASTSKGGHLLVARRGKDEAFLPENLSWWSQYGGWVQRSALDSLRWFVYDDRSMYRPGEKVSVKGWVRVFENREGGDIRAPEGAAERITYRVIGSRGNEIGKGTAAVNAMGGFDLAFTLPKTPNLGNARLQLTASGKGGVGGRSHVHGFQIQEFRRPEYEVITEVSPGPFTIGNTAKVTAKAAYYAGGGLAAADVTWSVRATPATFSPPGHEEFTFGAWMPWWEPKVSESSSVENLSGVTTSAGVHVIDIDFLSAKPPRPMSVVAEARVTDVNRQTLAAQATLLVHPSEVYVGLRRKRYFVERGKPIELDVIVVNQDGKMQVGRAATITAARVQWTWKGGRYEQTEEAAATCPVISTEMPAKCSLSTTVGGTYKITATVVDGAGRPSQSSLTMWVTGGESAPARNVEREKITLIPDRETYKPGDTAKLLVQAPFADAEGILTVRRSGIVRTERFAFKGTSHTLSVPIRDGDTPNLYVHVDVVGKTKRLGPDGKPSSKLPPRPAYGAGNINLKVPPVHRTLGVVAVPGERGIEPGGTTRIAVMVKDAFGKPVPGAEVSVVVVDESVLALSGKVTPDPLGAFYGNRTGGARDHHSRDFVKLAKPDVDALAQGDELEEAEGAPMDAVMMKSEMKGSASGMPRGAQSKPKKMMRAARERAAPPAPSAGKRAADAPMELAREQDARSDKNAQVNDTPITVRKNFEALASFSPAERTDASGRVSVLVTVPDNLTRYRVMVAAVDGSRQFGSGESSITARMPLMVRPSPPRFLNFGDKFELPVVVQNQTDEPMTVHVAVRAGNASLTAGAGRKVTIAANDRVEVRFPAAAAMPGTARFQVGASAGKWADASTFELPVWTPATTEAFATYGSVDEQDVIAQPIRKPPNVVDQFGGLNITTSSTQLSALTDALLYLVRYPHECAEQVSSRMLGIAGLRDVLSAFEADGLPSAEAISASMKKDVERLWNMQKHDGGFGFWTRASQSWPYITVHASHALVRAKAKGYPVRQDMLKRAQRYMHDIERHIPRFYSDHARWSIIAYSLYVRKLMGDVDTAKARGLLGKGLENLPREASGWLLYVLSKQPADVKKIIRFFDNKATETAGAATISTAMSDGAHLILHSSRRTDAVVLEALLEAKPRHDLIEKLVRGLLAHQKRGRWRNTQENVFILLAMDRYFKVYEKVTPNFTARAWLDSQFAGEHRFRGRTTERSRIDIPMATLSGASQNLTLQRKGRGRMYYRVGMTYAPSDLSLPPADHGFAVERRYESVDNVDDVTLQPDGTWVIKAGSRVRVRVTMVAQSRRHHVALVDPLPAGLEPMNPALKTTGSIPEDANSKSNTSRGRWWWWTRTWFEHQNMRDDRVEAFASTVWAGVHEYTYVANATTPGTFVVPPAKAEEMYAPETFGRSKTDKVVVK